MMAPACRITTRLLLFLYMLCCFKYSIGSHTISLGQSLSVNQTIVSKGGRFELGFFSPGNSTNYYIGIWYKNISVKTVVWVANRDKPITYSSHYNSSLVLSKGNLILYSEGKTVIWSTSSIIGTSNATNATLNDDGNFVLSDELEEKLWQSFHYPTDTWLPGGKVGSEKINTKTIVLTSWKNSNDPSNGIYTLDPRGSTEISVWSKGNVREWRSGLWNGSSFSSEPKLSIQGMFSFSSFSTEKSNYITYNCLNQSSLTRVVMDSSGVMKLLIWSEQKKDWDEVFHSPLPKCEASAKCGLFGISNCEFLPGNKKNQHIAIPIFITLSVLVCGSILCCLWLWRRKLLKKEAGKTSQNLLLLNLDASSKESIDSITSGKKRGVEKKVSELPMFSFSSISAATNNFTEANKLGEGGFGPVYKGSLLNGQLVPVKRLSKKSGQGLEELGNETMLIAKLQHRNLVRLLGCCIEEDEKILIYEYMPNKSLDSFLFDPNKQELLNWSKRVQIIEGIAQGLLYLHKYSRLRIIHRDLKASNILLDGDMNPKISDFGMARIFGGNELQANTNRIVGTIGYMSPEYAMEGRFSIKSDVFAFGVLLLEILSGKKNTGFDHSDCLSLLEYAWNLRENNRVLELMDPTLQIPSSSSLPLRYTTVGLLCVQESPADRPTISDVIAMFGNEQTALVSPKRPPFTTGRTLVDASRHTCKSDNNSINELTASVMEAR